MQSVLVDQQPPNITKITSCSARVGTSQWHKPTGFVFFLDSPSTYWQAAKVTYVLAIQWHNLLLPCLRENVRLMGERTSMKSLIAKQVQK